jgi:hypothetical protein
VDGFDKDRLVLILITLGGQVEVMIEVLGDLLCFSVLFQESSENSLSSHPENLGWHTGIFGTFSFTVTHVSTLSSGFVESLYSGSRVHVNLSSHDETILEELSDVFT